jgi:hypothetical protein
MVNQIETLARICKKKLRDWEWLCKMLMKPWDMEVISPSLSKNFGN